MDAQTLEKLIDGDLPWERLQNEILQGKKDPHRFEAVIEILEDRVEWDDPILLPLNDHLYLVAKEDRHVVKAECGHEFCDRDENWKKQAQVRVKEGNEVKDMYSEEQSPSPEWDQQIREFFCPNCYTLIDVEAVPAGYPVLQKFEPDIETFYEDWLSKEVPAP